MSSNISPSSTPPLRPAIRARLSSPSASSSSVNFASAGPSVDKGRINGTPPPTPPLTHSNPKPIISRTGSSYVGGTSPSSSPRLHPADGSSASARVSFPMEGSGVERGTHAPLDKEHANRNAAGLHSSFAHRARGSATDLTHLESHASADGGATSPPGQHLIGSPSLNATLSPDGKLGGYGMSRSRTTSTGAGTAIGPDFGYRRKVGFETFEKSTETALFACTLQAKSENYRRTRNTRVFQVAVSNDESGTEALDWLMESLIEDGDEVVALRVIELDEGEKASASAQEGFREDAAQMLKLIMEKNHENGDRRISVVVEYAAGKVTDTIMRLISLYRPDSLVVGTKGKKSSLMQNFGIGIGSVSKYCVAHSPVPVIVVRPERKVKKTLAKRQNDPKRGRYAEMVGGATLIRSRSAESRD